MKELEKVIKYKDMSVETKSKIIHTLVFPVTMYWYKSWTVKKTNRREKKSFFPEMWCWRKGLCMPWTAAEHWGSAPPFMVSLEWRNSMKATANISLMLTQAGLNIIDRLWICVTNILVLLEWQGFCCIYAACAGHWTSLLALLASCHAPQLPQFTEPGTHVLGYATDGKQEGENCCMIGLIHTVFPYKILANGFVIFYVWEDQGLIYHFLKVS